MGVRKLFIKPQTQFHDAHAHEAKAALRSSLMFKASCKCWSFLSGVSVARGSCQWVVKTSWGEGPSPVHGPVHGCWHFGTWGGGVFLPSPFVFSRAFQAEWHFWYLKCKWKALPFPWNLLFPQTQEKPFLTVVSNSLGFSQALLATWLVLVSV